MGGGVAVRLAGCVDVTWRFAFFRNVGMGRFGRGGRTVGHRLESVVGALAAQGSRCRTGAGREAVRAGRFIPRASEVAAGFFTVSDDHRDGRR